MHSNGLLKKNWLRKRKPFIFPFQVRSTQSNMANGLVFVCFYFFLLRWRTHFRLLGDSLLHRWGSLDCRRGGNRLHPAKKDKVRIIFQNALSPYQRVWPSFLYSTASILEWVLNITRNVYNHAQIFARCRMSKQQNHVFALASSAFFRASY